MNIPSHWLKYQSAWPGFLWRSQQGFSFQPNRLSQARVPKKKEFLIPKMENETRLQIDRSQVAVDKEQNDLEKAWVSWPDMRYHKHHAFVQYILISSQIRC